MTEKEIPAGQPEKRRNRCWRQSDGETGGDYKFRIKPFLKGLRESKEQSSGVRIKSGRLKKPLAGRTGLAGISRRRETALFHRLYAYSLLQYIARFPERLVPQKIVVSCFSTKCGGHAVRPANNFLRAAKQTGVQQHPKNAHNKFAAEKSPSAGEGRRGRGEE